MQNPGTNDTLIYCDLCCLQPNGEVKWNEHAQKAIWDAPTKNGPWAYVCERHKHAAYVSDHNKLKFNNKVTL